MTAARGRKKFWPPLPGRHDVLDLEKRYRYEFSIGMNASNEDKQLRLALWVSESERGAGRSCFLTLHNLALAAIFWWVPCCWRQSGSRASRFWHVLSAKRTLNNWRESTAARQTSFAISFELLLFSVSPIRRRILHSLHYLRVKLPAVGRQSKS